MSKNPSSNHRQSVITFPGITVADEDEDQDIEMVQSNSGNDFDNNKNSSNNNNNNNNLPSLTISTNNLNNDDALPMLHPSSTANNNNYNNNADPYNSSTSTNMFTGGGSTNNNTNNLGASQNYGSLHSPTFTEDANELAERKKRAASFRSASRLDATGENLVSASGRLSAVPFDNKSGARARASMLITKQDGAEQEAETRRKSFNYGNDESSDESEDAIAAQLARADEEARSEGLTCWQMLLRPPPQDFIPVPGLRHFKATSCFIFAPDLSLRVFLFNVMKHKIFEAIIIVIIIANCVFLALADPGDPSSAEREEVAEYFFTAAFTVEMVIKIIALGFAFHQDSYLRDGWNCLDFFIVCLSYLNFISSFGNFTALRTFRVFRPLRSMNAVKGLKILVSSLIKAMMELIHIGTLSLAIIFMFAILGVQLFGGLMDTQCVYDGSIPMPHGGQNHSSPCKIGVEGVTYWGTGCEPGYTCQKVANPLGVYYSFDNVLTGMLIVFTFTTFEAWTVALETLYATVGVISFLYFFVTIIFTGFVLPNLVLAVINYEYVKLQEEESERSRAKREEAKRKFVIAENVNLINKTLNKTRSGRLASLGGSSADDVNINELNIQAPKSLKKNKSSVGSSNGSSDGNNNNNTNNSNGNSNSNSRALSKKNSKVGNNGMNSIGKQQKQKKSKDNNNDFPESNAHNPLTYFNAFEGNNNNNNDDNQQQEMTPAASKQNNDINNNILDNHEDDSPKFSFPTANDINDAHKFGNEDPFNNEEEDGNELNLTCWELTKYYWEMVRDYCHIITEGYPRPQKPLWYSSVMSARSGFWNSSGGLGASGSLSGFASIRGGKRRKFSMSSGSARSSSASASGSNSDEEDDDDNHNDDDPNKHANHNPDTPLFGQFIVAMILFNTLVLATQHYNQPQIMEDIQSVTNIVFTVIFAVEMGMKLMSLGPRKYIKEPFNILDGAVVIFSFVELGLSGSNTISVFRTFRLLRILKLFKQFPSLRAMVRVTMHAIRKTTYLLLIVGLYLFIIALLGVALFYDKLPRDSDENRMTYDNFVQAFLTSFQILAVDGWVLTMYQAMDNTNPAAAFFFVIQQLVGNFVLLSLFLSILIDSFDDLDKHSDSDELDDDDIPKGKGEHAVVLKIFDSNELKNVFGRVARKRQTSGGGMGGRNSRKTQIADDDDEFEIDDPDEIPPEAAFKTIKLSIEMEREFLRAKRHFGIAINATGIDACSVRREVTGKVSLFDVRAEGGLDGGMPLSHRSDTGNGSFNFKNAGLRGDDSNIRRDSMGHGMGDVQLVEFDGNDAPIISVNDNNNNFGGGGEVPSNTNNNNKSKKHNYNNNNPMISIDGINNDNNVNAIQNNGNNKQNNKKNRNHQQQRDGGDHPQIALGVDGGYDDYSIASDAGYDQSEEYQYDNYGGENRGNNNNHNNNNDDDTDDSDDQHNNNNNNNTNFNFNHHSSFQPTFESSSDEDDEEDFLNFGKTKKQLRREERMRQHQQEMEQQLQMQHGSSGANHLEYESNIAVSSVGAVAHDAKDVQVSLDVPGFDVAGGDSHTDAFSEGGGFGDDEDEHNKKNQGPVYENPVPLTEVTMENHNVRFVMPGQKPGKRPLTVYDISTEYLKEIAKHGSEDLGADAPLPEVPDMKDMYMIDKTRVATPTEHKPVVAFGDDENDLYDFKPQNQLNAPVILDAHGAAKADPLPVRRAKVCPACQERMEKPLPSAPLVIAQTSDALHKLQCKTICVRKAKEQVLEALLLVVDLYITVNETVRYDKVEAIIGQGMQCGMLLSLSVDEILNAPDVWKRLEEELEEQRAVIALRVGEEEIGKSLIGYATRCVPEEHRTNGGKSLWLFRSRNPFRVFLSEIVHNVWFDRFILFCIVVNSGTMAASNPLDDPEGTKVLVLETFGLVFTGIFTLEAIMKIIALGFVMHPGSYLRDPWNCMDGFIVVISLISDSLTSIDISFLSVFRTMRAIRPLRVINRNRGLKMVVRTLLESIKGIANIALIIFIVFLIFGILAVQLFSGNFQSCSDPTILHKSQCNGLWIDPNRQNSTAIERYWGSESRNFNNIGEAFLVLFEVCTGEAWIFIMWRSYDACDTDFGPDRLCNVGQGFFFLGFYAISGFFLIQLFVGVVVHNFKLVKQQLDGSRLMDDEQKLWISTQQLMLNFRPTFVLTPEPDSNVAHWLHHNVVATQSFDLVIGLFIVLNIFAIAADYPEMSDTQSSILEGLNYFFSAVFMLEAGLKLTAYHLRYFESGWNQFDFFLVCVSIVGIFLTAFQGVGLPVDLSILRVFRIFRILRILRLVRRARKIKLLLETIFFSLPSLANVGLFVLLTDFVFSILGVDVFAKVYIPPNALVLNDRFANYRSLDNALMLLFRFQTLEDWVGAMRDLMISEPQCDPGSCGTQFAPFYFLLYITLCSYVITNLLIAVILDNFETAMKMEDSQVKMNDLHRFVEMWSRYDPEATFKIKTDKVPHLLGQLQQPLGFSKYHSRNIFHLRELEFYHIPEHGGYVHFIETLIPLARRAHEQRGKLPILDAVEIREHEEIWKVAFPELRELDFVRHRNHTCTVEQYFAATHIACSYRRTIVLRYANQLRTERMKEIAEYCDTNHLDTEAALDNYTKNLRARVTSDSHRAVSESLVRAQMEKQKKKRRRKKQSLANMGDQLTNQTSATLGIPGQPSWASGLSREASTMSSYTNNPSMASSYNPSFAVASNMGDEELARQQSNMNNANRPQDEYEYVDDEEEEDETERKEREAHQAAVDREAREELQHLHSMMTARSKSYSSANSFLSQLKETEEIRHQNAMNGDGGKKRNRSEIIQGEVDAKRKLEARAKRIAEMSKISRRRQILREGGDLPDIVNNNDDDQQQNSSSAGNFSVSNSMTSGSFQNNNNNPSSGNFLRPHNQSLAAILAPSNSPNKRPNDPLAVWIPNQNKINNNNTNHNGSGTDLIRAGSDNNGSVDSGYFMTSASMRDQNTIAANNASITSNPQPYNPFPHLEMETSDAERNSNGNNNSFPVPFIQVDGPNYHYDNIPEVDVVGSEGDRDEGDYGDDDDGDENDTDEFEKTMTPKNNR